MDEEVTEYGDDDFTFDYEVLRKWGLILAVAFFGIGMAIIFSKKLRCGMKKRAKSVNLDQL